MRSAMLGALAMMTLCAGCGASAGVPAVSAVAPIAANGGASAAGGADAMDAHTQGKATSPSALAAASDGPIAKNGAWIGAAAESEMLLAGTTETLVGIWVDAPMATAKTHAPMDLALVIDTSGSMAGDKIANARSAAKTLVESLHEEDIVSIDLFNDEAKAFVAPTTMTPGARRDVLAAIDRIAIGGGTNMFAGLGLGETHVAQAPASHTIRRVVVISDGIANVGPSSPAALGALAERGLSHRAQVTSLGVGIDYDEHTLNALAVRTSGRLYHLGDPREMPGTLAHEMELLQSTVASDAIVEVVPAPGVQLIGADGIRTDWGENGALRIPLGALFGGQHREALVRVRVSPAAFERASTTTNKPLASVRLRFRDPADGDIERVQEVVARASLTNDAAAVASHVNARTQSIAAIQNAAKLELAASQSVNGGNFADAEQELRTAETALRAQAQATNDSVQKKRLDAVATSLGASRASAGAAAAAPKAVQRNEALKMNKAAMDSYGY